MPTLLQYRHAYISSIRDSREQTTEFIVALYNCIKPRDNDKITTTDELGVGGGEGIQIVNKIMQTENRFIIIVQIIQLLIISALDSYNMPMIRRAAMAFNVSPKRSVGEYLYDTLSA